MFYPYEGYRSVTPLDAARKNVRCEYDRSVVETQLCKLRDTEDALIGRACVMFLFIFFFLILFL